MTYYAQILLHIAFVLWLLIPGARLAHAQGTGAIHGAVTDASSAAVPNAKVTAVLGDRGATRTVATDTQGGYVLPSLPIGSYSVRVEVPGFKTFVQSGVELSANENARVDAVMEIGNATESISVTGEALLVDSRSSAVGTLIDSRRVVDLPTNGRNIISLAGVLPGVA
jgi:hypothetical protein